MTDWQIAGAISEVARAISEINVNYAKSVAVQERAIILAEKQATILSEKQFTLQQQSPDPLDVANKP